MAANPKLNFRSDNESPAHPAVLEALADAATCGSPAYGADDWTRRLDDAFGAVFERECRVFPLISGTAANALSLAQLCPPYGGVFCHEEAHIAVDECGAPESIGKGLKLLTLPGDGGRLTAAAVQESLQQFGFKGPHEVLPSAISVTQATEAGTVYTLSEIDALAELATNHELHLHMDGARIANAIATLSCQPADIVRGLSALSFGGTKNGALGAEAAILFTDADGFDRRVMQAGHLLPRMKLVSSQLLALLADDLWLTLAQRANEVAATLADWLTTRYHGQLRHPVEANEVFVALDDQATERLRDLGLDFHAWPGEPGLYRFVCAWCSSLDEVW